MTDKRRSETPWFVLTGDTLFVGSVGRPDLAGKEAEMAGQMFDSLHQKLLTLPDEVEMFPGHTSGSVCGAGMSGKPSSTIGFEKRWNPDAVPEPGSLRRRSDRDHSAASGGDGPHGRNSTWDAERCRSPRTCLEYRHGIRDNLAQFPHQLVQVLLVGLTIGMMRTVVPALAESEFGVAKGSFMLLIAFVVAFGFVKGTLNFVAGRLSERIGRKKVLLLGWLAAVPIPFMILYAPSWSWIVAATVLLGINQGLTWSMTQTSKLDITRADQRGLTIGLNEFSGYVGVAVAGIITGYLATASAPRRACWCSAWR